MVIGGIFWKESRVAILSGFFDFRYVGDHRKSSSLPSKWISLLVACVVFNEAEENR